MIHTNIPWWFLLLLLCLAREVSSGNEEDISSNEMNSTTDLPATITEETNVTDWENTTTDETTDEPLTTTHAPPDDTFLGNALEKFKFQYDDICSCDLKIDSCDVNCCCDPKCTAWDRQAFSRCISRSSPTLDPRYCFQSNLIVWNNTEYKVNKTKEDLFCIYNDNLAQRNTFFDRKPVDTANEIEKILQEKKPFSWPTLEFQEKTLQDEAYRAGNPIWTINALGEKSVWSFPARLITIMCETSQPIRYMEDESKDCTRLIDTSANDCSTNPALTAATFYEDFCIVAVPQNYYKEFSVIKTTNETTNKTSFPPNKKNTRDNQPWVEKCSSYEANDTLIAIEPCLCNNQDCSDYECNVTISSPTKSGSQCINIVSSAHYLIRHNGTAGIEDVQVFISLTNGTGKIFEQRFSTEFQWLVDNSTRDVGRRSGNPGYLRGLPVLLGTRVDNSSSAESEEVISPIGWMSVFKWTRDGECDLNSLERSSLGFGVNSLSVCSLASFQNDTCANIRKVLLDFLLGEMVDTSRDKFVAMFGNFDALKEGDWVKVIGPNVRSYPDDRFQVKPRENVTTCFNLIQGLDIDVVFSYVGAVNDPQAKIQGVRYKLASPSDISLQCPPCVPLKPVQVTTRVTFVDVTQSAVREFGAPPGLNIQLPYDFFYPFLFSSYDNPATCWWLFFLIMLVPAFFWVCAISNQIFK